MDRLQKIMEFLQKTPDDPFLQHALGLEYLKLGDPEKAREVFEALLNAHPGYVGTYYQLGKLLESANEPQQALQWYEKGMEQARLAGEHRALQELRSAYDELA